VPRPRPEPAGEPARQPHQVRVVQLLVALLVPAPPPEPEPARILWAPLTYPWVVSRAAALIESTNTKIRLITRMAFGFASPQPLIALAYSASAATDLPSQAENHPRIRQESHKTSPIPLIALLLSPRRAFTHARHPKMIPTVPSSSARGDSRGIKAVSVPATPRTSAVTAKPFRTGREMICDC